MSKPQNEHSMRPMLADKFDAVKQRFPVYVQPKFDGIRCMVLNNEAFSRKLIPIPNAQIQKWVLYYGDLLNRMDGELIVGNPCAPQVYRRTMSGVMSRGGSPDFTYYVFDLIDTGTSFEERMDALALREVRIGQEGDPELINRINFVRTKEVYSYESLLVEEADLLSAGYEGAILRSGSGKYKYGRSTTLGGELIKLKRFLDEEATIIGFEELRTNTNEALPDNFGLTKRSSHAANKIPANTLGALVVRNVRGQKFNVGTGFDQALRSKIWDDRDSYLGKQITYRYVKVGGYDLPRFPVFHGFRDPAT